MAKIIHMVNRDETAKECNPKLWSVPEESRTAELCLEAVKKNGEEIRLVPEKFRTEELCFEAVRNSYKELNSEMLLITLVFKLSSGRTAVPDGGIFGYIPECFRTEKLYLEAVMHDGMVLEHVPQKFKTEELCRKAVKQNGLALGYMPEEFKTKEFCLETVKQDGRLILFVPDQFKTEELCLEAVQQNGRSLRFVPERFKTEEICREAVRQYGPAVCYVPAKFKQKLLREAVLPNGEPLVREISVGPEIDVSRKMFEYIPEKFKTAELCLESVKKNGEAIKFVPEEFMTMKLCLEAVKRIRKERAVKGTKRLVSLMFNMTKNPNNEITGAKDDGIFEFIPEKFKTAEFYGELVRQDAEMLNYVPEEFMTMKLCLEAVKRIKGEIKIEEITEMPIDWIFDLIPERFRTAEFYAELVRQDAEMLDYIPEEFITVELYLEAVKQCNSC